MMKPGFPTGIDRSFVLSGGGSWRGSRRNEVRRVVITWFNQETDAAERGERPQKSASHCRRPMAAQNFYSICSHPPTWSSTLPASSSSQRRDNKETSRVNVLSRRRPTWSLRLIAKKLKEHLNGSRKYPVPTERRASWFNLPAQRN